MPWVVIQLETDTKHIKLLVENSTYIDINSNLKKGIGTDNLKKRLQILYPNKFKLELNQMEYSHQSVLEIYSE